MQFMIRIIRMENGNTRCMTIKGGINVDLEKAEWAGGGEKKLLFLL